MLKLIMLLAVWAVLACDDDDAKLRDTSAQAASMDPTYSEHVAPLLRDHCSGCHSAGGIAPLQLTTYGDVQKWGERIKLVTAARTMPPFLPDNSGRCATYFDANWLRDEEIALLGRWVDMGMPPGLAAEPLAPLTFATLQDRTNEARIPQPYLPDATLRDDYRCFLLEDDFATGHDHLGRRHRRRNVPRHHLHDRRCLRSRHGRAPAVGRRRRGWWLSTDGSRDA